MDETTHSTPDNQTLCSLPIMYADTTCVHTKNEYPIPYQKMSKLIKNAIV